MMETNGITPEPDTPTDFTVSTALALIKPDTDSEVMAFFETAVWLRNQANQRIITIGDDMEVATNDLSIIATTWKAMEAKRKEYLRPFRNHIEEISDAFKRLMEPIMAADKITRDKMLVYTLAQKLIRKKQEEVNRLRIEAAEKEMELKGELSESVNLVEVIPEPAKTVQSDLGTAGQRDNWKWRVIDFALVPDEYKMINPAVLTPAAKSYKDTRTIPGIEIYNEPIIAVNAR